MNYRKDIDGLRAIAVMSVVLCHAFPQWIRGGFIGVDIFFVISGYLISYLIFKDIENTKFSLRGFYKRRIARIFPALLVVMVVVIVFGWFSLLASEYKSLGKYILSGSLFASNFIAWKDVGYFDGQAEDKPLLHLWSLGVEEQFYLIWPLALIFFVKFKYKHFTLICALGGVSFLTNIVLTYTAPISAFYSPFSRFFELMLGAAIAHLHLQEKKVWRNGKENLLSALGIIAIGLGLLTINSTRQLPGFWVLLPVIGAALVILAGPSAWFNRTILSSGPMVRLGLMSYALYLWHWPLLSFARIIIGGVAPREVRILCVLLAVLLAWMTYQFIELPVRQRRRLGLKGNLTPIVTACIAVMGVVCLAGGVFYFTDGLQARVPKLAGVEAAATHNFEEKNSKITFSKCKAELPQTLRCLPSKLPETESILVIGDSHGGALAPGLYRALQEVQPTVSVILMHQPGGCSPLRNVETYDLLGKSRHCKQKYNEILDWVANNNDVKTIILVAFWQKRFGIARSSELVRLHGRYENYGYTKDGVEIKDPAEVFTFALRKTISELESANKKVVFAHQVPEFKFNPPFCGLRPIPLNKWDSAEYPCTISRSFIEKEQTVYRQLFESVKLDFKKLIIAEPTLLFCNNDSCSNKKNSDYLYLDTNHLNSHGAYLYGKQIAAQLYP